MTSFSKFRLFNKNQEGSAIRKPDLQFKYRAFYVQNSLEEGMNQR